MNIRKEAYVTLLRINYEGAYSNLEVKGILKNAAIKDEDRRLYLSIVYGTLQNQMGLDYLIRKQIKRPLKKIQKEVLEILRMAYYQLYFLDRIPDYAIVNEAVKLTQKVKPKAKGFVNGVLRNQLRLIEEKGKVWEFREVSNRKERLAIENSMPLWITKKYFETFPEKEAIEIIKGMNEQPPFTIRLNSLKINRQDFEILFEKMEAHLTAGEYSPVAYHIENMNAFQNQIEKTECYQKGYFAIQDQGAMLAVEALGVQKNETVLDMCAAPGGKTTYLSQLMENTGSIVARDIYPNRLKLIQSAAKRMGCKNIQVEEKDGCLYDQQDCQRFDRILLDAPCSGLGVLRRKPEIRYQMTEEETLALAEIQEKMLKNAKRYLKPGGYLLYSTCTINKCENEERIEAFLETSPNMQVIEINHQKYHHTSPLTDGSDGFFMCLMQKINSNNSI